MTRLRSVVIVGTGLAGLRTAETLRARGFDGRVLLVGEEEVLPYERPALSKQLLVGSRSPGQVLLRQPEFFVEQKIELLLGRRVEKISASRRRAVLSDGEELRWDALVLATGARARRLQSAGALGGVHYLRTLADALTLREELVRGRRLAVVGAGFIGAEVASAAVALGLEVTMIDPAPAPLERVLGPEIGALLVDRYRSQGADVRLGRGVCGFAAGGAGRIGAVQLGGGEEVACDLALVGIGAEPAGELLGGGEIATDASGRTSHPGIYACGDVASSWRPSLGRRLRIEHWTSAAGQAATVASTILGEESVHDEVPFFWSDQFGLRLQHVGFATEWEMIEIEGESDSFSARYLDRAGRLLAALAVNRPGEVAALRRELAENVIAPRRRNYAAEPLPTLAPV
jgi:3-phenylpropionate/trans-cinnamate dioxygenase ferredoxin reductase subunit